MLLKEQEVIKPIVEEEAKPKSKPKAKKIQPKVSKKVLLLLFVLYYLFGIMHGVSVGQLEHLELGFYEGDSDNFYFFSKVKICYVKVLITQLSLSEVNTTLSDDERSISRNVAKRNIRDSSHDKNLPIMSVTGSINQNVFK